MRPPPSEFKAWGQQCFTKDLGESKVRSHIRTSEKSKGSAPDASSSGETSNSSSYSTRRRCFDSMGLAHPEGQADMKKGAGKGRAEQGRQATIRTPSNITKTEFCLVTHQGSGSGARGQALCTLLLVGGHSSRGNGLHPATTAMVWKTAGSSFLYYLLERTLGLLRKGKEQWSLMSSTSSHPRRHSKGHHDLGLLGCQAGGGVGRCRKGRCYQIPDDSATGVQS